MNLHTNTGYIHLSNSDTSAEQEATRHVKEALRRRRTALAAYARSILGRGLEAEILKAREGVRQAEDGLARALLELEELL